MKLIHPNPTLKSPIISPESLFESGFYKRRFGPNECARFPDVKIVHLGRLCIIRRQNRLKWFQIENDSEKGVPFLADRATDPLFQEKVV